MIKNTKYAILFLASITLVCTSDGQKKLVNDSNQYADSYSTPVQKHLKYTANDVVMDGYADSKGNLWFGTTQEGVFKYDGTTFTNYITKDGLCNNQVNAVLEAKDGTMWFGTASGLCKYDGEKFETIRFPWDGRARGNTVLSLMQDSNNFIWLGTWGGGAYRYDGFVFLSFLAEGGRLQSNGLYNNVIRSIIEDKEKNIWIASLSHGGITRYDGTNMFHLGEDEGLGDDMAFCVFEDSHGTIWSGGNEEGILSRFDGKTSTHYSEKDGLTNTFVSCFFEDKEGNLWMGGEGPGVCIYDGQTFKEFTTKSGQTIEDTIRFILEDQNGNIWLGGRVGSLWKYDGVELIDYTYLKYN